MYAFSLAHFSAHFREQKNVVPCTWNGRICLVVAKHLTVLTSSRLCTCRLHQCGQRVQKIHSSSGASIWGQVPTSGNTFMALVMDRCTRTTSQLVETHLWKAGLSKGLGGADNTLVSAMQGGDWKNGLRMIGGGVMNVRWNIFWGQRKEVELLVHWYEKPDAVMWLSLWEGGEGFFFLSRNKPQQLKDICGF